MLPEAPPLPPPDSGLATELKRSHILEGQHTPPTAECFRREAQSNGIDPYVLLAVLQTENGRPGEMARNRNGSYDLGPMSINTVWIPTLAKRYQVSEEDLTRKLASDGCANVSAAAWILGRKIAETGNVWEGVARFHSTTPAKQASYLRRVQGKLSEILVRMRASLTVEPR